MKVLEKIIFVQALETNMDNTALVDMDGTIANYQASMQKELEKALRHLNVSGISVWDPKYKPIQYLIKNQPGFWKGLGLIDSGITMIGLLKDHGLQPHILTKGPYKTTIAWTEKAQWCRKHLCDVPITISENKGLIYGKILVDDWPPYCESWLAYRPRGLILMPSYDYNIGFENKYPGQVVKYDPFNIYANISNLSNAIVKVAERKPGEPLVL